MHTPIVLVFLISSIVSSPKEKAADACGHLPTTQYQQIQAHVQHGIEAGHSKGRTLREGRQKGYDNDCLVAYARWQFGKVEDERLAREKAKLAALEGSLTDNEREWIKTLKKTKHPVIRHSNVALGQLGYLEREFNAGPTVVAVYADQGLVVLRIVGEVVVTKNPNPRGRLITPETYRKPYDVHTPFPWEVFARIDTKGLVTGSAIEYDGPWKVVGTEGIGETLFLIEPLKIDPEKIRPFVEAK